MKRDIFRESPDKETQLLTIAEACAMLRIRSPKSIYEMLESGQLRTVVIGHRRLIPRESVEQVIREGEQITYKAIRPSPRRRIN